MVVIADTHVRHLGLPEDVAAAVACLASPDLDFISGEIIKRPGGKNSNSSRLF